MDSTGTATPAQMGQNSVHVFCPSFCPSNTPKHRRNLPESVSLKLTVNQLQALNAFTAAFLSQLESNEGRDDNEWALVVTTVHGSYRKKIQPKATFPQAVQTMRFPVNEGLALLIALTQTVIHSRDTYFKIQLGATISQLHSQLI